MSYGKKKKYNPVVEKMKIEQRIKFAMNESKKAGIEFASIVYNVMSIMVLYDKLGLTDKQIDLFMSNLTKMAESINEDYIDIPDVIKTIKEEHGIKMNDDIILKYYPSLEGYLSPENT